MKVIESYNYDENHKFTTLTEAENQTTVVTKTTTVIHEKPKRYKDKPVKKTVKLSEVPNELVAVWRKLFKRLHPDANHPFEWDCFLYEHCDCWNDLT